MGLRRAPIWTAGNEVVTRVVGSWTRVGLSGGVVVGDLFGPTRIADVEHTDPGIEIAAGESGRAVLVVHAAVVAPVRESGQAYEVGQHLGAVGGVVHF